jgi:predicted acylesterase/phospholipase RssA
VASWRVVAVDDEGGHIVCRVDWPGPWAGSPVTLHGGAVVAKIGLALSGGGFRATLYHLGVVRFLRDAGILPQVTHITAVSGGSILAAHLVLNWDKFNGTDAEFNAAADKLLDFIRLDIRNRIVRRYPFAVAGSALRWISRRGPNRMLTRSGLLERYYAKHLFGDTCLYELPKSPDLHLLSTNLSEGCLCSFTRDGLIMQRRLPGDKLEFERIAAGLASVSLAVATSSAFPGFFPPISIKAADIGASELAFTQQAFTDGGVFDNLGVRAFRFIERCWGEDCNWGEAATREVQTEQLTGVDAGRLPSGAGAATDPAAARAACEESRRCDSDGGDARAARNPSSPVDESIGTDSAPTDAADDERSNRDASSSTDNSRQFHEEFGRTAQLPSAPPTSGTFDAVITSDAGGKFMVNRQGSGGGLIRTAMRSSDILMDRVWQLEKEIVGAAPGFLFVPIAQVVERHEDPHALAPVVQRQVTNVRTDLDRFSEVEIRSLAMHGYSVARRACRLRPEVFGEVPDGPPWDPVPPRQHDGVLGAAAKVLPGRRELSPTETARQLQRSGERRIWGTLLDARDLMTYAFVPLMVILLAALPYLVWKFYSSTTSQNAVLATIAESDHHHRQLVDLLRSGPPKSIVGLKPVDVPTLQPPDNDGFDILTDFHVVDLRQASRAATFLPRMNNAPRIYEYRRLRIRRTTTADQDDHLRFQYQTSTDDFDLAVDNANVKPRLKRLQPAADDIEEGITWELDLDLSEVKPGETANVGIRRLFPGTTAPWHANAQSVSHLSYGNTRLTTMWLFLPESHPNARLQLVLVGVDSKGGRIQSPVTPTHQFRANDGAVVGWQLLDPQAGLYECQWQWR